MEQLHPPGGLRNLWIISRFELIRLFLTPRGLMSIAAFAIIWYFILRYPIFQASQFIGIPGFKDSVGEIFGQVGLQNLLEWPVSVSTVFDVALFTIIDGDKHEKKHIVVKPSKNAWFDSPLIN